MDQFLTQPSVCSLLFLSPGISCPRGAVRERGSVSQQYLVGHDTRERIGSGRRCSGGLGGRSDPTRELVAYVLWWQRDRSSFRLGSCFFREEDIHVVHLKQTSASFDPSLSTGAPLRNKHCHKLPFAVVSLRSSRRTPLQALINAHRFRLF